MLKGSRIKKHSEGDRETEIETGKESQWRRRRGKRRRRRRRRRSGRGG